MSEDEARKKFCPHSMRGLVFSNLAIAGQTIDTLNRDTKAVKGIADLMGDNPDNCVASDCMMWGFDSGEAHGDTSNGDCRLKQ